MGRKGIVGCVRFPTICTNRRSSRAPPTTAKKTSRCSHFPSVSTCRHGSLLLQASRLPQFKLSCLYDRSNAKHRTNHLALQVCTILSIAAHRAMHIVDIHARDARHMFCKPPTNELSTGFSKTSSARCFTSPACHVRY
eukprot:2431599-Amphidinium_carterae.1